MIIQPREPAWRVFADELVDTRTEIHNTDGGRPFYLLSPLGAKLKRVFVVGVLTELQNLGDPNEPFWRARLADPTGEFDIRCGTYQPTASKVLAGCTPPMFLAVVGKVRAYIPDPDKFYVSIWPETIRIVDKRIRNYWLLETCQSTLERIEMTEEMLEMTPRKRHTAKERAVNRYQLRLYSGIEHALGFYGPPPIDHYKRVIATILHDLGAQPDANAPSRSAMATTNETAAGVGDDGSPVPAEVMAAPQAPHKDPAEYPRSSPPPVTADLESQLLSIIQKNDDSMGSPYDVIIDRALAMGLKHHTIDDAMDSLLAKGLIYEPMLGRLKVS